MSMSPEVQAEYDRVLAAVAIRKGTLMTPSGRIYGWIADDWEHLSRCKARTWGKAKETTFTQFEGTFAEGTRYRTAIDVQDVSCHCGQVAGREVRWEPSDGLSEVTEAIFAEMYTQLKGGTTDE
jgi:hypothetical protein